MAYNFTIHKIASGTVPWTQFYHNYVQAVQEAVNTLDAAVNTNTANISLGGTAIGTNTANIATNTAAIATHTTQLNNGGVLLTEHSTRLNETLTYTYVERIAGVRTSPLGVHTYITTDARLAIIQAKLDFIMDTLKQLNVPYLDDSLTVVPATTPNP
jgi:hypothetical protein